MKLSFSKTEEEQSKLIKILFWPALIILLISIYFIFSANGQVPDASSINYENVVQSHIMLFKLKIAMGLFSIGSFVSYGMTHIFSHTSLGSFLLNPKDTDDSSSKAARIQALAIVYGASLLSIFFLLTSVLGK